MDGSSTAASSSVSAPSAEVSPAKPPIKIKIVSWNLGDSLPKGELNQLFGDIPNYEAPERLLTSLPDFGKQDGHPYHIVVIANQECPTQSGVPRGLGGGITKGLAGQKEKEKLKERGKLQGLKDAEKQKKDEVKELFGKLVRDTDREEAPFKQLDGDSVLSPGAPRHGHHTGHVTIGGKGWSDILEDYFVNGVQQVSVSARGKPVRSSRDFKELKSPTPSLLDGSETPSPVIMNRADIPAPPQRPPGTIPPPAFVRTFSAPPDQPGDFPITITPSSPDTFGSPMSERNHMLGAGIDRNLSPSPLSMFSMSSETSSIQQPPNPTPASPIPSTEEKRRNSLLSTPILKRKESAKRLTPITIPGNESPSLGTPTQADPKRASGPYHFLVKERLLGLYLAVFVHKDALDWVEGYDHDFVPTGLMGGRMGNKGGIGISLKMAGHRFLFVCAHLAAHASRMEARISNVDKIKTELGKNLNCFLPEDDPQASESDITERFDTTFWFGDLNFRLDVSRLHADWLVQHKEYEKALEFDQLRNAMREGKVFEDFAEGEIDFAPTFKYDVWHSAKKMRRRGELPIKRENVIGLPGVEEDENGEEMEVPTDDQASFISGTTATMDRRGSVDSSLWLSGSLTTGIEEENEDDLSDEPNTVQQPARPIAAVAKTGVIKAKHRFMKIMKSASPRSSSPISTPSPRSESPPRSLANSYSSQRTLNTMNTMSQQPSRTSIDSTRRSIDSEVSRPGLTRGLSKRLKRTLSGRQDTPDESSSDSEEDTRQGVYDTSSKQRVPSWCDRVLWKTHVEEEIGPQPRQFEVLSGQARFKLFGHAIAQKFHRRHRDRVVDNLHTRFNKLMLPYDEHVIASQSRSHEASVLELPKAAEAEGSTPRASVFSTTTIVPDKRLSNISVESDSIKADQPDGVRTPTRRNSLSMPMSDGSSQKRRSEPQAGIVLGAPIAIEPQVNLVSAHFEKPDSPRRFNSGSDMLYPRHSAVGTGTMPRSNTTSTNLPFPDPHGETSLASAKRWFSNLPGLLMHPRNSIVDNEDPQAAAQPVVLPFPPTEPVVRRKKGEVDCLEYTTIDDIGMRKLEGRSDHRPIIFSAAVYP